MILNDQPAILSIERIRFKIALDLAHNLWFGFILSDLTVMDLEVHRDLLNKSQDLTSKIQITKLKI